MKAEKKKKQNLTKSETPDFLDAAGKKYILLAAFVIILIPVVFFFTPYLFEGLRPSGSDSIASAGETNLYKIWQQSTGETALWNPSIFGGLPIYPRITPQLLHIDTLISYAGRILYEFFIYLMIGGIGIFMLLRYRKIPWYIALIPAVAFVLLPDWHAMIGTGHYSKFRAVMILPFLILCFNYFLDRNNWTSAALFALVFSWLIRTHHFQIIFYGILILAFLFLIPVIRIFFERKLKENAGFAVRILAALLLTVATSAQPFLTIREYTEFSTRGGNAVSLAENTDNDKTSGVSFEYATNWSLHPREIVDCFIPRFTGGKSAEIYDGDKYPNLKGREVPGYWGDMPFTENYDAIGFIMFLFAVIGAVYFRKDRFVIGLSVFVIFSVLLALGKNFDFLYRIFFDYIPYFSKFRVPVMILNVTFISVLILAGFGLKAFLEESRSKEFKWMFSVFLAGTLFVIVILLIKDSFVYIREAESTQYDAQTLQVIKDIRNEFLTADVIRLLVLLILSSLTALAYYLNKIKRLPALFIFLIITVVEIGYITGKQYDSVNLILPRDLEANVFKSTPVTGYLSSQEKNMRAISLGNDFQSNNLAYFYPTINGYSAIKLQVIQDIIENNLFNAGTAEKINWNVISMLNGKYILLNGQISSSFLKLLVSEPAARQFLYENQNVLPKAWFVRSVQKFRSSREMLAYMNDSSFIPSGEALVLGDDYTGKESFSGKGNVKLEEYSPNSVKLETDTEEEQFLILSEIFYPRGWKAFVDGNPVQIHKTNHLLRGIPIPAGKHLVKFSFEPDTYFAATKIVWIGNILILLILVLPNLLRKRDYLKLSGNKDNSGKGLS